MTQRDNGNEVLAKLTIAACTEERTISKVSKLPNLLPESKSPRISQKRQRLSSDGTQSSGRAVPFPAAIGEFAQWARPSSPLECDRQLCAAGQSPR
jgi:hypothetical protein